VLDPKNLAVTSTARGATYRPLSLAAMLSRDVRVKRVLRASRVVACPFSSANTWSQNCNCISRPTDRAIRWADVDLGAHRLCTFSTRIAR